MRILLACLVLTAYTSAFAGPDLGEVRKTGSFHGVTLTCVLEVDVSIGPATKVELRGPQEWLARVETKVVNGALVASMPGRWNNVPRIKLLITTPELTSIDISGVAGLHAGKLAGKTLDVHLSGVGSVALAGTVEQLRVDASGTAELLAKQLVTRSTVIDVSGTGEATVHATKQIAASISGTGSIIVYGKPASVQKSISGAGEFELR